MGDDDRARERQAMVTNQLQDRGVRTIAVLDAFRVVPRERFVPASVEGAGIRRPPARHR